MAAFTTQNPPLALVATAYHAALVGGVYTVSRSLKKVEKAVEKID